MLMSNTFSQWNKSCHACVCISTCMPANYRTCGSKTLISCQLMLANQFLFTWCKTLTIKALTDTFSKNVKSKINLNQWRKEKSMWMIVLSPKPPILAGRALETRLHFPFLENFRTLQDAFRNLWNIFSKSLGIFGNDQVFYKKSWHSQDTNLMS